MPQLSQKSRAVDLLTPGLPRSVIDLISDPSKEAGQDPPVLWPEGKTLPSEVRLASDPGLAGEGDLGSMWGPSPGGRSTHRGPSYMPGVSTEHGQEWGKMVETSWGSGVIAGGLQRSRSNRTYTDT